MRTRLRAAIFLFEAFLCACAGTGSTPALTVSPSGNQTVSGPTVITASRSDAAWSLTGPGSLSGSSGREVVYRPPPVVNAATAPTATVTATSSGQTASVTFQVMPSPAAAPGIISGLQGAVTVIYDAEQVPHIFCGNQLDCFAAQGYLHAQDRLFQMDLFRRTARGQLASLVGSLEASQDRQFLTLLVTRDGKRIEDVLVDGLDAGTKAKLDAYSGGVNAYLKFLAAHPTLMPQEYAQLPGTVTPGDVPAWTPQDTLAIGRLQQFQLSETIEKETDYGLFALTFGPGGAHQDLGRFNAYVRAQQPLNGFTLSTTDAGPLAPSRGNFAPPAPDLGAWAGSLREVNAQMKELHALFGALRLGSGSNNWVVDAAHSASGNAMVANDPHLSLQYPPLFHLSAMTASDSSGLNVAGGAFPGVPGALVGRGAHVGWGVTVVGYDVTDLYTEKLTTCTGSPLPCNTVRFNGAEVPILPVQYTLKVKGEADQTVTVLVVPHHGPILSYDPAHQTAISMRWTGHEVTADLRAFLGLTNASAVGDAVTAGTAFAALKDYATGAQNFVLADDQGHIGYDPHALVPRRKWLEGSSIPASGPFPWFPMTGDGTAEWGSGNVADNCAGTGASAPAAACWVPDAQLPQGKDPAKGYFVTANSDPAGYTASPFAPFGSTAPTGLYPYLSYDWDDPTDVRYSRIAELLKAKTANGKVSLADMLAIQNDHAMLIAKLFAPSFPAAATAPAAQQVAYGAALAILTQWGTDGYDCPTGLTGTDPKSSADPDATRNRDSAACYLFHTFLRNALNNVWSDEFAVVTATTGKSFGGDFGAEIRGLLYALKLPDNDPGAAICNDIDPDGGPGPKHTCKAQLVTALATAYGQMTRTLGAPANWLWGRSHTLTTASAAAPLIAGGFSAGPYARPGGALTVDVGNPDGSQSSPLGFTYSHGSNVRHISVMDPIAANAIIKMQLPGPEHDGPSGLFASDPNLLLQWVQNQPFDYAFGHQVDGQAVAVQGFTAQ